MGYQSITAMQFSSIFVRLLWNCSHLNARGWKEQCTKKLMSSSPRLVDFAVRLVDFILYLPDRQVKVLGEFFFC